jgi:tRNA threonylcarbamoyladenosine biosynthesis protein TsaE
MSADGRNTAVLTSEAAQEAFGAALASACHAARPVIFLVGDLGAGKTTLARGFLRGLGHAGSVKSPTYTLIEPYDVAGQRVYHLDLYRVADPGELEFLGLRDLLDDGAILLVEWPERGQGWLPTPDLTIRIDHSADGRRLSWFASGAVGERLAAVLAGKSFNVLDDSRKSS